MGEVPALDHLDLRKKTAMYMRNNSDTFLPFMDNPDTGELFTIEQYEKYCSSIADTNAWGGAIEVLYKLLLNS